MDFKTKSDEQEKPIHNHHRNHNQCHNQYHNHSHNQCHNQCHNQYHNHYHDHNQNQNNNQSHNHQQHISKFFLMNGYILQKEVVNFIRNNEEKIFLEIFRSLGFPKIITVNIFLTKSSEIISLLDLFFFKEIFDKKTVIDIKERINSILKKAEKEEKETKETTKKEVEKREEGIREKEARIENVQKFNEKFKEKTKKIEVKDFLNFFRSRYSFFKDLLKNRNELNNLFSIDKMPRNNQSVSVIGMVLSKRETKNKNIILTLEDLKGSISILVNKNKKEVYEKAQEVIEDEVIGVRGFGNREIIFASDIVFPEIINYNEKKCENDSNIIFVSDIHVGSNNFLESNFKKFVKWVNGDIEIQKKKAKKITHIFLIGDLIDGVGIYPGQEDELFIHDVKEQYKYLYELLDEIRKDVHLVFIPGNHDAVTLTEPQFFNEYSSILKNLENAEFLSNPSYYHLNNYCLLFYHGYSLDYYANNVYTLKQKQPYRNPETLLKFLITKRHLAPTHGSTLYSPQDEDFYIVKKIPDIFVTSHIHKTAVDHFRNIFLISTSCWQARTTYQEKFGHIPDPCKAIIFNTKEKKVNIIDFS